eukprot:11103037-Prorocentrum_lima.AAC.1
MCTSVRREGRYCKRGSLRSLHKHGRNGRHREHESRRSLHEHGRFRAITQTMATTQTNKWSTPAA